MLKYTLYALYVPEVGSMKHLVSTIILHQTIYLI